MQPVALRHVHRGAFLNDGAGGPVVTFDSGSDAAAFCHRYLDEPLSWEAVVLAAPEGADAEGITTASCAA